MTEGNTNVIQASADVMLPPLTSEGDDLVAWAESHHFTTDTLGTLHSLGCNKMAIIIALEPYDVTELGLNIGQCRVLLPIIQQARGWHASSGDRPAAAPPHPYVPRVPSLAIKDAAGPAPTLSGGLVDDRALKSPMPFKVSDLEIYLHMATCKSDTPCYNVIDFVAGEITIDEESVLAIADGVELIAQPMQLRRCKWQHVTVTQRSAAKSSIMAHAIRDGLSVLWGFSSTALSTHWVPTTRKWFDFFHISWWTPWDSIVWIGPVK